MSDRIVLITGITGNQGGAVAKALVGKGLKLRGMTRKPESDAARAFEAQGVEIVRGDLDDEASLGQALEGVWGVFAVQNTWEAGVEREEEQGKRLAKLARAAGVQHYVYTSVGSAERKTGIPHFDNKWRVEETVRGLEFPSHVILRPVFFMENLLSTWFMNDGKLMAAMDPETSLQMVAVEDIGKVGAQAFLQAEELKGQEIELAGDSVTIPKAAEVLSKALGKPIEFARLPIEAIRQNSEDFALMLEWFDKVGYGADISALRRAFGDLLTLEQWALKKSK